MKKIFTLMIAAAVVFGGCSKDKGDEETSGATGAFTDPRDGKTYKTVVMPDGRTWMAENLHYTKDLVWNQRADRANGVAFTSTANGAPAIGSYWCPAKSGATITPDQSSCDIYGALYTWETAMMVDGKWADEMKTSSVWNEAWVSDKYHEEGMPNPQNNARGGRGICPPGWHVPTIDEWAALEHVCSVDEFVTLKSSTTCTSYYIIDVPGDGSWGCSQYICSRTDKYGFNALPAGSLWYPSYHQHDYYMPEFNGRGTEARYIRSAANSLATVWCAALTRNWCLPGHVESARCGAYSIRCIRDE